MYEVRMPTYEEIKQLDQEEEHRITLFAIDTYSVRIIVWEDGKKLIRLDEMSEQYISSEICSEPISKLGYANVRFNANRLYDKAIRGLLTFEDKGDGEDFFENYSLRCFYADHDFE